MSKPYVIQPARRVFKDPQLQQAIDDIHNAILPHTRAQQVYNVPFGNVCTPNLAAGGHQVLTVTDGRPITIAAPIGWRAGTNTTKAAQVQPPAMWSLHIQNVSNGVMGPVTFDPSFLVAGFVAPGPGQFTIGQFFTEPGETVQYHHQVGSWTIIGASTLAPGAVTSRGSFKAAGPIPIAASASVILATLAAAPTIHEGDLVHLFVNFTYSINNGVVNVSWVGQPSGVTYLARAITADNHGFITEAVTIIAPVDGDAHMQLVVLETAGSTTATNLTAGVVNFQNR